MESISIVIPVKNVDDPYLSECLESLKNQTYQGKFEILVVEGGNIAQARNAGIFMSHCEIIAFIDSDCIAPKNWLEQMINFLRIFDDAGGIGGPNISNPEDGLLSEAIDEIFGSYFGSLGSASLYRPKKPKKVKAIACINSVYWRNVLLEAGGFDEKFLLNEDTNLSYRVRSKGYNLYLMSESTVYHHRKSSFKNFYRQFFNYGVSRMRSIITDLEYIDINIVLPFLIFIFYPFLLFFYPKIGMFLLFTYLLFIIFFGIVKSTKRKKYVFLYYIPTLFIIQHFSYAFGLIYGIIKGKWNEVIDKPNIKIHKIN